MAVSELAGIVDELRTDLQTLTGKAMALAEQGKPPGTSSNFEHARGGIDGVAATDQAQVFFELFLMVIEAQMAIVGDIAGYVREFFLVALQVTLLAALTAQSPPERRRDETSPRFQASSRANPCLPGPISGEDHSSP